MTKTSEYIYEYSNEKLSIKNRLLSNLMIQLVHGMIGNMEILSKKSSVRERYIVSLVECTKNVHDIQWFIRES